MGKMVKMKLMMALILVTVLIASQNAMMQKCMVAADKCNMPFPTCVGVCYKRGKCNACCKQLGYLGGKCKILEGMACYCCHEDHDQPPPAVVVDDDHTAVDVMP
uniref:Knottin scorpion toxin-like domain-containing protein n=1 Tax=Leersia perrieri TaxID=77586 RepID=A0A0D9VB66_9ORYZ